jgi:hypothetical protein
MVERLRRDKPEVVEVLRLLPACECGATLLEPVSAWWGGRLVRLDCGAAPGRAVAQGGAVGARDGSMSMIAPSSRARRPPHRIRVTCAMLPAGCFAAINGMPAAPAEH